MLKWCVFLAAVLIILILLCISGIPARAAILAGVFTGILTAFAVVNHVNAETLEERIGKYAELYCSPEISEYIFVGDSRTVGMHASVQDNGDVWSCKESMGYDWMVSDGIPAIEDKISADAAVFILLGVNDLGNSSAYADYVNRKAAGWPGKTFFVSVGPVTDTTVTNTQIEAFNSVIRDSADSYGYIDLYSSMVDDGFSTVDGLHYTADTYRYIYDFLKNAA